MRRHRRLIAGVALVLTAVAVCLPGLAGLDWVLVERDWTLLPAPLATDTPRVLVRSDEQPTALGALLPSRAPPLATCS